MFKLIDLWLDRLSGQIAENFCNNLEIVEQNRSLRQQSEERSASEKQEYMLEI